VIVEGHAIESFSHKKPTYDLTKNEDKLPVLWFGSASVYFNAFVRPESPRDVASAVAVGMHLHDGRDETYRPEDRPVVMTFETAPLTVAANQSASVPLNVYFGPRDRKILRSPYYATFPREYQDSLVLKVGPCAACTWVWLIDGLVMMLKGFWWLMGGFARRGDWGLAIILLVGVVRLCLHPITKRSQVQMMRMGKLGPEVEKLKKKHGDNKEVLNREMMQLYKEQGFAPIFGCLPMFLQMPIWIALYSALQTTFELRQEPFLWGFTWIKDLSKPDYLIQFSHPFTLFFQFLTFDGLNILPILMGVVFWFNNKYTPKPPATTPEQVQQQKMMQWMTLLFPVFLYNGPSGLNLYILTSTFIGIVEAKVISKHIKEREEAEKAGKVIVDAGRPTRVAKRLKDGDNEPPKKGGFMGWLADLQARVEDARGDQRDRGGKRKA
jgi:YidC/Oxa1 family membrane protein insertase